MIGIQDVRIGAALRERLSLDGAGQLPLGVEQVVVPVVMVADVSKSVELDPLTCFHQRDIAAVAAQYGRAAFEVQANASVQDVYLDRIFVGASTAQRIRIGFSGLAIAPNVDCTPRRKRYTLRSAAVVSRMIGDTSAVAPVVADYQMTLWVPANTSVEVRFAEPIIMDEPRQGALLVVHADVVNTALTVAAEWRELPRVD